MNPARTFDFVQKHPEAATVIEQFKMVTMMDSWRLKAVFSC